jgi:hypothetical protein
VKSTTQFLDDVERRLARTWAATLTATEDRPAWPHPFPLGEASGAELAEGFTALAQRTQTWRAWAREHDLELRVRERRVKGTVQELPTHVVVPDIDTAARLAGTPWPDRLRRARQRAAVLTGQYRHLLAPARTLTAVDALSDVNFDLLRRAADWFASHDASGLTARQVPIEGLHAKWLNNSQHLVRELANLDDLGLLPAHPQRIHFTYLDPSYRATGGRVHDSATVGDSVALAYHPRVVVISENKDTAIHFPALENAVSIEGVGRGGATIASFDWVTRAEHIFYWGDMDADGLEILDGFRAAGVPATSVLMNPTAYQAWERFGTNLDPKGRELPPRTARPVPFLTAEEAHLYAQLIDPDWAGRRRIEQERIPLRVAVAEVRRHLPWRDLPARAEDRLDA